MDWRTENDIFTYIYSSNSVVYRITNQIINVAFCCLYSKLFSQVSYYLFWCYKYYAA